MGKQVCTRKTIPERFRYVGQFDYHLKSLKISEIPVINVVSKRSIYSPPEIQHILRRSGFYF